MGQYGHDSDEHCYWEVSLNFDTREIILYMVTNDKHFIFDAMVHMEAKPQCGLQGIKINGREVASTSAESNI